MSWDIEIHKQRHISLMFAEFPNKSPLLTMIYGCFIRSYYYYDNLLCHEIDTNMFTTDLFDTMTGLEKKLECQLAIGTSKSLILLVLDKS